MTKQLIPIYKLRVILLKTANPKYFDLNRTYILGSSFAAQDYVLSGHYYEYDKRMGLNFKQLPEYTKVHKKYNLPYNPKLLIVTENTINPGLVMDLAWSLQQDKLKGIIDSEGNIINASKLQSSEVLQVYHNTSMSGYPINILKNMKSEQINQLLSLIQNKTR